MRSSSAFPATWRLLQLESLETRQLLTPIAEVENEQAAELNLFSDDDATESHDDVGASDAVPVLPFDDHVSPVLDCPGMDPDLCLPGDLDGNGMVDFDDFLHLSNNMGIQDATYQDGDIDGDGLVSFDDFLILSAHFQVA